MTDARSDSGTKTVREAVATELIAHGEFSLSGNNYPNALLAADQVIKIVLAHTTNATRRDAAQTPSHIERTPAGTIDWKMEALRSARLLADAERIIAEYKAQAIEAARQSAQAPERCELIGCRYLTRPLLEQERETPHD